MLVMMVSISASKPPQLSTSRIHKTFVVALLASAILAASGCGKEQPQASQPEPAPRDLSGSLATDQTGAQPGTQQPEQSQGGAAQPQQSPSQETTDFAPVDVELAGGSFAKGTPKTIHIPSGFIIVVSARADDSATYKLSVTSPSAAQTFTIKPKGEQKITLDALREGESAKLIVGDRTVKIAADAEPGP